MKNKTAILTLILFSMQPVMALDLLNVKAVNPIDNNPSTYQTVLEEPKTPYAKGSLSQNVLKNQYTIAMNKFMQSNIQSSYNDFKMMIDNVVPCDYYYTKLAYEMAEIGFFNLANLSLSKVQDKELTSVLNEDIKLFYFPKFQLSQSDEIYLAEIYSNIEYNNQSKEATSELEKQTELLTVSDYANYLVAFGNLKNGNISSAEKAIDNAININPQNINYKRLKAEIYALSSKPQDGIKYFNEINSNDVVTTYLDNELLSTQQYILYKTSKNEYWKKYHLAYYYYTKKEYSKAIRVLQTSISGKKNINKDVFKLTALTYFEMKEYEKAQDYALKTLDLDKKCSSSNIILGDIALRNNKSEDAEKYYKKALSGDDTQSAQLKLAKFYKQSGDSKKAKELYSKVLKTSSKSYEAYYNMALLDKTREETYIKKTLAINPDYSDAWVDLARICIEKNDYDNAAIYLRIVNYLDNNNFRYYYYEGLLLKNSGLNIDANKNFEKCLKLNPNFELARKELSL